MTSPADSAAISDGHVGSLLEGEESRHEQTRSVLRQLIEVAQDFLRTEYPTGTIHPADVEAARLERAVNEAQEALDAAS